MENKTLGEALEEVLREDPRMRDNKYLWLCLAQTLRNMGFKIYIELDKRMPSPESILKERREILNKKNLFSQDFVPDPYTTYEKKVKN